MNSRATEAGVAALIEKAQQLHRQSDILIRQAQTECKHPNLGSHRYRCNDEYDSHAEYETSHNCPDCGKRWVE